MNQEQPTDSPWIVNATPETFDQDVFQRSQQVPVVVDFWAEWCAPCRQLGPILEKLAVQYNGRFVLVKADTERLPTAAAQFQVQSIPAVYGVVGGEIADYFVGALPESQLRERIDRILLTADVKRAMQLEDGAPEQAEAIYRQVLEQAPDATVASIGLARVLLAQDRPDQARAIVETLESRGFLEPEAEQLKAAMQLSGKTDLDVAACRRQAEQHPDDLQAQLALASALAGDGQYPPALEICLSLVERDRQGVGEQARQLMVDVFRVLPADSELTGEYRRKLAMLLY
jgi:putative thioredoxin